MMVKSISVILTCACSLFVQGLDPNVVQKNSTTDTGRRILFGEVANPEDFPFLVRLHKGETVCGGSIISNNFILTAAHCIVDYKCPAIDIFPSTYQSGQPARFHPVQCLTHDKFVASIKFYYDIGLLKTSNDLLGDGDLKPIPLPAPGAHYPPGTPVIISGWGILENGTYLSQLLRGKVLVEDWDTCNYKFKHAEPGCISDTECPVNDIPKRSMCTQGQGSMPQGTCFGDSGGPVIINGNIAGVVNGAIFIEDQCAIGYPTLHSNVTEFLPWIYSITEPDKDTSQFPVTDESN